MLGEVLRDVELFRELRDDELERLGSLFFELFVPAEEYLFEEGEPADAFFVIRQGTVLLLRDRVGRPLQLLGRLEPGDFFGEHGLFATVEHSSAARAAVACRILQIEKAELLSFLDAYPAIALKLQVAAGRRHRAVAAAARQLGRRREVRIRLARPALLTLEDDSVAQVTLENVSSGGVGLSGVPEQWDQGDVATFRLDVAGAGAVHCSGRVAWVSGDRVGIAFDPSLGRDFEIEHLLQKLLILK